MMIFFFLDVFTLTVLSASQNLLCLSELTFTLMNISLLFSVEVLISTMVTAEQHIALPVF